MCPGYSLGRTNAPESLRIIEIQRPRLRRWPNRSLRRRRTFSFWFQASGRRFYAAETHLVRGSMQCQYLPAFGSKLMFLRADILLRGDPNATSGHPANRPYWVYSLFRLQILRSFWLGRQLSYLQLRLRVSAHP